MFFSVRILLKIEDEKKVNTHVCYSIKAYIYIYTSFCSNANKLLISIMIEYENVKLIHNFYNII